MPPKKRVAEDDGAGAARGAKAAKTDTKPKGGKKGPKANLAASAFKERALPIHINITHTPPALVEPDGDGDGEGKGEAAVSVASADPGFIGTATLLPGTFSTGSYGWKGNKRFAVEIDGPDGGKEKVHVMLTLNATVIGSKSAKEDDDTAAAAADGEDGAHAEANGEAKEAMEEAVQEEEDA